MRSDILYFLDDIQNGSMSYSDIQAMKGELTFDEMSLLITEWERSQKTWFHHIIDFFSF